MTDDEIRERGEIEGFFAEWLSGKVWDESSLHLPVAGDFRPLYAEEAEELGYDDDDPVILLRRESDGKVFEAEIDVTVRPSLPLAQREASAAEMFGQLRLPGVA